jgi:putative ABC transport system permease protein
VTLKLALRNLFRNSRRTALNLMIMAGGYSAVVIFHGFAANILEATRWGAVESQYGHIQIGNQKLWDRDSEDSFLERQLKDPGALKKKISSIEGVRSVSERQSFYGLVSTGDRSVAAQIVGYEPEIEKEILNETTIIDGDSFLKHTA